MKELLNKTKLNHYEELLEKYGELMHGKELFKILGYRNNSAFRMAKSRGTLPVKVFRIENRQGNHAFTRDVIQWLLDLEVKMLNKSEK
jgi:hypothetical protein